ncbi:ubiquitin fusion degradation protein 1 homolog [Elysia marginata]|uniref:Ubiquitin fusion degradation protein 1 homolog n=1 Tax=Elysia marginata TaxID=1093978 RepID=A0AAV4J071_9GAST|nr:ubiquitin fusion degradation protein 1 homolog [Elysia marginata]
MCRRKTHGLGTKEEEYELFVLESKPGKAVSIIECDMSVDFAQPIGYKEPERVPRKEQPLEGAQRKHSSPQKNQLSTICHEPQILF